MSKRGLSLEEKRKRLLDLFYEKEDFFQLKDLEKIAPKEKGIISQSVKEVLQSLVDDGLVDTEKVAASSYFWAYPSKALNIRQTKITNLTTRIKEVEDKLSKCTKSIDQAKVGRDDSSQRTELLEKLAAKNTEKQKILNELQKYRDNDPEVYEAKEKQTVTATEAANRWTDNVETMKSWLKNKFCIDEETLNKQFNLPAEMEYL